MYLHQSVQFIFLGLTMRIIDLLEGKDFDELEFVRKDGDKSELDYDLVDDLTFFMNNDDDIYRRLVYPAVQKCVGSIKNKSKINHNIFKTAAVESYKTYVKKFPIRELTDELEDELCNKVCLKMKEDLMKQYQEGKYKD